MPDLYKSIQRIESITIRFTFLGNPLGIQNPKEKELNWVELAFSWQWTELSWISFNCVRIHHKSNNGHCESRWIGNLNNTQSNPESDSVCKIPTHTLPCQLLHRPLYIYMRLATGNNLHRWWRCQWFSEYHLIWVAKNELSCQGNSILIAGYY